MQEATRVAVYQELVQVLRRAEAVEVETAALEANFVGAQLTVQQKHENHPLVASNLLDQELQESL